MFGSPMKRLHVSIIMDVHPRSSTATNAAADYLCSRAAQMLPAADAERP
jgi:hypothetical protein